MPDSFAATAIASATTNLMEIRTFATPDEITSLPGYKGNNPVNTSNYETLIGDYNFGEEVRCCFSKADGHICGEGHKWGFVAKLKDGTVTMVGNVCAQDRFGADAKIKADRSKYLNEKKRRETLVKLAVLLEEQPARLKKLSEVRAALNALQERVEGFTSELGPITVRRLKDMVRTGRADVTVNAITFRSYVDERGNPQRERSVFSTTLGSFAGISILSSTSFQAIYSLISDVERAYLRAQEINVDVKSKELESLTNRIGESDRILATGNRLLEQEDTFFQNNFLPLCFLTDDKAERYKSAKVAMQSAGESGGKEKAKAWLAYQERNIKKTLKVDSLDIR